VADFIAKILPDKAYLSIPTRTPAIKSVDPPDKSTLNRCFKAVVAKFEPTEYHGKNYFLRKFT